MTMPIDPTDPFEALRAGDVPVAPRASFAAELRARLTAALAAPTTTEPRETPTMTVHPYLSVRDCAAALQFYADAFGAVEQHRIVGDDGRVGHAEFTIGTSTLMIADEYPEVDALGPQSRGGPTCMFQIEVADVDAAFERAVGLGATVLRPPADQFHGNRNATIADPFGHRWSLTAPIGTMSSDEYAAAARSVGFEVQAASPAADPAATDPATHQLKHYAHGDLYYFTIPVADLARAQAFFGAVLGWHFDDPQAGHVSNISAPPGGVRPAAEASETQLWFVVDDIDAAVAKVRELGGSAQDPVLYDSGAAADCVDDQGTRFSLSVPAPKYRL